METKWRALVVTAQLESAKAGDRLLVSLDVGVVDGSSQLKDFLDSGVDVIDSEEEIGSGARITPMDAAPHIWQRDHITLTRRSRFELPTEHARVEGPCLVDVFDTELDKGQFARQVISFRRKLA